MTRSIHWAMVSEGIAVVLAFLGLIFALHLCTGCAEEKAIEAEAKYGAEQYQTCVASEPYLGPNASAAARSAAWARVDSCRERVKAKWSGITETVSVTDGGDQ